MAQVKAEEEAENGAVPALEPAKEAEGKPAEKEAEAPEKPDEAEAPAEIVPREEIEKTIIIPSNRRSTRKKKKQLASVLEMLREYEEEDAKRIPKIEAQLMLNLDDVTESLIESPKK
jgi:hypothetical protein